MDINGINQEVLDHNSFSQGLADHNDAIREHNSNVMTAFNTAEATRKSTSEMDDIFHGVTGPLQSGFALYNNAKQFKDMAQYKGGGLSGVANYISDTTKDRTNNIYNSIKGLTANEPATPEPTGVEVGGSDADTLGRLNTLGAGEDSQKIWGESDQSTKDFIIKNQPTGETAPSIVEDNIDVPKSTLPTSLEDATSRISSAFGASEGASSVVGNVAGKLSGIGAGAVSVIDQVEGKDKTTLQKDSGILSDIGAGLDIVGSFIPVLEPLGALATAGAGVLSGISDVEDNVTQQKTNKKNLTTNTLGQETQQAGSASTSLGGSQEEQQNKSSSTSSF
tara:strand:+ start:6262 stop:7266 length:1005 start_codon:yes stop_codon:yes gene_type:complete